MIRIITSVWNAQQFLPRCIASIQLQNITRWKCYIYDDLSTDGSFDVANTLIRGDSRFVLIRNKSKNFPVGNHYHLLLQPELDEDDIIVAVDADDWLPDPYVFQRVLRVYSDPNVWITWGSYQMDNNGLRSPGTARPFDLHKIRTVPFQASHLRTFKTFLWRQIRHEDLLNPEGTFWDAAGDMSFMLPMLEMAGYQHSRFLPGINYIYSVNNPLSDFRFRIERNRLCEQWVRDRPSYPLLSERPKRQT